MLSSSSSTSISVTDAERSFSIYNNMARYIESGQKCLAEENRPKAIAYFRQAISMYLHNSAELTTEQVASFSRIQTTLLELVAVPEVDILYQIQASWIDDVIVFTAANIRKEFNPTIIEMVNRHVSILALVDQLNFQIKKYNYFLPVKSALAYKALHLAYQIVFCLVKAIQDVPETDLSCVVGSITDFLRIYCPAELEDQFDIIRPACNNLERVKQRFTQRDQDNWNFLSSQFLIVISNGFFNETAQTKRRGFVRMFNFSRKVLVDLEKLDKTWEGYHGQREKLFLILIPFYLSRAWHVEFSATYQFYKLIRDYYNDFPVSLISQKTQEIFKAFCKSFKKRFEDEHSRITLTLIRATYLVKFITIQDLSERVKTDAGLVKNLFDEIVNFRRSFLIDFSYLHQVDSLFSDGSLASIQETQSPPRDYDQEVYNDFLKCVSELGQYTNHLRHYTAALQAIIHILSERPGHDDIKVLFKRRLTNICGLIWVTLDESIQSRDLLQEAINAIEDISTQAGIPQDALFLRNFRQRLAAMPSSLPSVPVVLSIIPDGTSLEDLETSNDKPMAAIVTTAMPALEVRSTEIETDNSPIMATAINAGDLTEDSKDDDSDWLLNLGSENNDDLIDMYFQNLPVGAVRLFSPVPQVFGLNTLISVDEKDDTDLFYNNSSAFFSSPRESKEDGKLDERTEYMGLGI